MTGRRHIAGDARARTHTHTMHMYAVVAVVFQEGTVLLQLHIVLEMCSKPLVLPSLEKTPVLQLSFLAYFK